MARSCLYFVFSAVIALLSWASHAAVNLGRVALDLFSEAFPVTAPVEPITASIKAPKIIGLFETRAFQARRERRLFNDLSIGCDLRIAA